MGLFAKQTVILCFLWRGKATKKFLTFNI